MSKYKQARSKHSFTFIDLFAGIGGFHLAFHRTGAKCVFASEWDKYARETYKENFRKISSKLFSNNKFAGDITKISTTSIPDFDILTGGFPCQPFSQAGHKKGFSDTRGTLFYDIRRIIKAKKPKAYFIENVRHLHNHDGGKTFETIKKVLTKQLGYSFYDYIVKASDYGLPQHRPRLFMIGFKDRNVVFKPPKKRKLKVTMSDVFEADVDRDIGFTLRVGGKGSGINDRRNWDAYRVNGKVQKLSIKEGKRMQGFPDNFVFPVSNTQAMKQLGNSVAVNAVQDFAKSIIYSLNQSYE